MLDKLVSGALQGLAGGGNNTLMQVVASMLSNNGQFGGLAGLVNQLQQAGLGEQINSWVSNGRNLPVSADQLMEALGQGRVQQMARDAGVEPNQFGGQLVELLPQMVDKLTPQGQVPSGGLDDALSSLAKLI